MMMAPRVSTMGAPPAMQPPMNQYAPGAITQTTLPPMGAMSQEQLVAMIMQALNAPPSAQGYGPR
jgi:hypothetical protein